MTRILHRLAACSTALVATVALSVAPAAARADTTVAGDWTGSIAGALTVIVHIDTAADGRWQGTLAVPQQGVQRKLEQLVVSADQLSFALPEFKASYAARWSDAEQAWVGSWSQGQSAPLVLKRAGQAELASLKPQRPQEAAIAAAASAGTAPYSNRVAAIVNAGAGVQLAGTLSIPHGAGPFPAVVLVHGSGPLDRDEVVFDHKLFLVLADHLNRRGIAVLRYDKRGIGASTGNYKTATTLDFASDAQAALGWLRSQPGIDPARIGILGHSEGGLIAPLVATREPALRFVVMLAGPGVRGDALMVEQLALAEQAADMDAATVARDRLFYAGLFGAAASAANPAAASVNVAAFMEAAAAKGAIPAGMDSAKAQQFASPWFHDFLRHDPIPVLRQVRQPILVLNGELDRQVPAELDLAPIRAALAGNQGAHIAALPKLNHLLQTASTGAASEYPTIAETMAPAALEAISGWMTATLK